MIAKEELLKCWEQIDKIYEERTLEYLRETENIIDGNLKSKRMVIWISKVIEKYKQPNIDLQKDRLENLLSKYEYLSFVIETIIRDYTEYYKITFRMKEE